MTLSELRHEILNDLNTIKLSCALLGRDGRDQPDTRTIDDIDRAADRINQLIYTHLTDQNAPSLLRPCPPTQPGSTP